MDCHLFLLKCILKKGEQSWRLPSQKVKKDLINDKQKKQGTGTVIKQDILEDRHNTIILAQAQIWEIELIILKKLSFIYHIFVTFLKSQNFMKQHRGQTNLIQNF